MKNQNLYEKERWLRAAQDDLASAKHNRNGGFHPQACFLCQQAGEKALKAFLYGEGVRDIMGHSLLRLLGKCKEVCKGFSVPDKHARLLDRFYIPTRYPNGLPDGTPMENYTDADSEIAINTAEAILGEVKRVSATSGASRKT